MKIKNLMVCATVACLTFGAYADRPTVAEPEFVHGYIHLTSDSTFNNIPKEQGEFKKPESKKSKLSKIGGAVAGAAGTVGAVGAGMMGMGIGGAVGTVISGTKVASKATSVVNAVGTLDLLAGMEGVDIVFNGNQAPYAVSADEPLRIIVREENNKTDPLDLMRVVRFNTGDKERKIKWLNIYSGLLASDDARKNGYLNFTGQKYGESSYLITIPAEELEKGEYGIIIGNAAQATLIPVATFSVK